MNEKYYLDTSIWMDYYEDRKDPSKDLGEFAFRLLQKLLIKKSTIVVSNFIQKELETMYSIDKIRGLTIHFDKIIEKANITDKQREEALKIAKQRNIPRGDALHAILARDNNAILVSRDKHFQSLKDICKVVKPEEII